MDIEWDSLWTLLIGPRRSGKTTLGKYLSHSLITRERVTDFLYLNCDLSETRLFLDKPEKLQDLLNFFSLEKPIIFIDEVQRLRNPGLVLKTIIDAPLIGKFIASGSSQLELKSKVQENLTGRNITSLVLPLSWTEWDAPNKAQDLMVFGSYPQVIKSGRKNILLGQLYDDYISKDIIEFLKIGQPHVFEKLLALIAHSSGQLVNYSQFATDCQVSTTTIKNYIAIAEATYLIAAITPYVGNKRVELTTNPIIYFLDNGVRNYCLKNFTAPENRVDLGLLVQSVVFQELYKYLTQKFLKYHIHYWRTKSGAEVDFIIAKNPVTILPVEVKFQAMKRAQLSKSYRSFIEAYEPAEGIIITKDFIGQEMIGGTKIHFIPLENLTQIYPIIDRL